MTTQELIIQMAKDCNITRKNATQFIHNIIGNIQVALQNNETVRINGLGNFRVRHRAAHEGHNPATGEKIAIPAKNTVVFKAAKPMKALLN